MSDDPLFGFSEADAINAMRPGGNMDRVVVNLTCETCKKEANLTLRELYDKRSRCTCGGIFDYKEFIQEFKLLLSGRAGPFDTFYFLPGIKDRSDQN